MNYPFTQAVLDYGAYGTLTTTEFAKKLVAIQNHYPTSVNQLLFNLLGSHDTPRILTQVHENKELLEILYVMLFTAPGTPCIYYGDEIGITGDQDPGCRKCMVWEEEEQDRELFTFIQSLIQLRTENPALTHGKSFSINLADNDKKILIYRIQGEGEDQDLIVTLCLSPTEQHVTLPADLHEFNRKKSLMQKGLSLDGETVIFQPFSYAIFST
nr:alpha-amylase family glycosyl hydrolase [Thalassobacillus sp. C254]